MSGGQPPRSAPGPEDPGRGRAGGGSGPSGAANGSGGSVRPGGAGRVPPPRNGSQQPAPRYPLSRPARMTAYLLLGVLGAATGLAGALIVDLWSGGGLALGTAGIIALGYGGGTLTGTRTGAVAPTAAWLGMLLIASVSTPKGDLIWGGSATSLALLFLGLLGSVLTLARPSLSGYRQGPSGPVLPPASPRRDASQ